MTHPCTTSIQWLDDSPATPCVLPKGHDGGHQYGHAVEAGCFDCGNPLASADELESGLCLRHLHGPVPR